MGLQGEQETSHEFMLAVIKRLEDRATTSKELEIVVEQILPVLVPAIIHLLKAVEAREAQDEDDEDGVPPIRPLDHLARFLMRRNPRHTEPSSEVLELQAVARRLSRK